MSPDDILHGGQEELVERIKQLRNVIEKSEKYGVDFGENIDRLHDIVLGMEDILSQYDSVTGA
ncbi:MAG: hypothetical protein C0603_00520 [Denitrovibrio sp.]|nr:MAG: hypothetical protein C0603_00520 [Denitrovibrio sp.]